MLRKIIGKLFGSSKKGEQQPASENAKSAKPSSRSNRGEKRERTPSRSGGSDESPSEERGPRRRRSRGGRRDRDDGPGASGPANESKAARPERKPHEAGEPPAQRPRREQSGERPSRDGDGSRSRDGRGRSRGRDRDRDRDRGGRDRDTARGEGPRETGPVTPKPRPTRAPIEIPAISEDNEFVGLGLVPAIAAAVEAKGYTQPTPIQSEAIPVILSGRDVIGSAQTGTGKTAAFSLPILQKLGEHGPLRCLILEPTRELALQVDEALQTYGKFVDLSATVIYGGVGYGAQREAIASGLDIIVATPGRLLDHIEQRAISLSGIQYLVLDEVDRMLDMGFLPDVKKIIGMCPTERQTLFFSATIPPELEGLTKWCLRDPHTIEIGRRRSAAETVSHAFYPVVESQKFALLENILESTNYESVLIFCRTKHGADFVANRLERKEHKVAVMHSNRSQSERTEALKGFKSGKYEVMVATDVAARGLDIQGVTHVINYDTPLHPEDYVHRIGRTGRAQTEGDAYTLLTEEEMKYAFAIERFINQKIERRKIEGFPYVYSAVFASQEAAPATVFRSRLYRGSKERR
jgi:ATP-dependent RNA helicase RhlE